MSAADGRDLPGAPPPEVLQGVGGVRARTAAVARGWVRCMCPQYPTRPFVLHIVPAWSAVYVRTGEVVVAHVEPTVYALCGPRAGDPDGPAHDLRLGNASRFGRMSGPFDPRLRAVRDALTVGGLAVAEDVLARLAV